MVVFYFRTISETEYEFKTTVNENHLNAAGITHGGYLSGLNRCRSGDWLHIEHLEMHLV